MNMDHIIATLTAERDRIDQTLQELQQLQRPKGTGRRGRKPNTMTEEERAAVSRRMKRRWAKVRAERREN